jgi:hypothetical protein
MRTIKCTYSLRLIDPLFSVPATAKVEDEYVTCLPSLGELTVGEKEKGQAVLCSRINYVFHPACTWALQRP